MRLIGACAGSPVVVGVGRVRAGRAPVIGGAESTVWGWVVRSGSKPAGKRRVGGIRSAMADVGEDLLAIRDTGTWRYAMTRRPESSTPTVGSAGV